MRTSALRATVHATARATAPTHHLALARDVLAGLSGAHKSIPGKWLHDARGAELLRALGRVPEHYAARSERLILQNCAVQMAELAGTGAARRPLVFIPGSRFGWLAPQEASALLAHVAASHGADVLLAVATDATQDAALLLAAYDDALGVAAAFNRNLLARLNRELGADFDIAAFRHEARVAPWPRRVELHLVSEREQTVRLLGRSVHFAAGESLHTASAHQYGLLQFQSLAEHAGWAPCQMWMDGRSSVAVHVFERSG